MGGGRFAGAMAPTEKPKDFKGTLSRLAGYLKPRKFQLVIVFIMAILSTAFLIVSPEVMGRATTELYEGVTTPDRAIDFGYIYNILLALLGLYVFSFFL